MRGSTDIHPSQEHFSLVLIPKNNQPCGSQAISGDKEQLDSGGTDVMTHAMLRNRLNEVWLKQPQENPRSPGRPDRLVFPGDISPGPILCTLAQHSSQSVLRCLQGSWRMHPDVPFWYVCPKDAIACFPSLLVV